MEISIHIHVKSVDPYPCMVMSAKFHIHGKPVRHELTMHRLFWGKFKAAQARLYGKSGAMEYNASQ